MNKGLRVVTLVFVSLLFVVGCSKRRTIPDGELARIFHDAFLANAYTTTEGIKLDSLRLYEPIFNKYGYSIEDVQYTIGSFSTRKSARLSDVVERSIEMLEQEGEAIDWEVAVLDTVSNIAVRRTTRVVHRDSLIWVKSFRDTSALRFTYERPAPGNYQIDFEYLIDSLDTTPKGYRAMRWIEVMEEVKQRVVRNTPDAVSGKRRADSVKMELKVRKQSSAVLNRGRVAEYSSSIFIDEECERLEIVLARSVEPDSKKGRPNVKIRNLVIKRVLPAPVAQDTLFRELLPLKIFDDELLFETTQNSL